MNFRTIRWRLSATITLMIALFGIAGLLVFTELRHQGEELSHTARELDTIADKDLQLLLAIKEIKVDVVQVQ